MDILLDTNIYISNPKINSTDWEILNDYLIKTDSKVILPQIVHDEISAVYKRLLNKEYEKYKTAVNNCNRYLNQIIEINSIDLELQESQIKDNIIQKLNIHSNQIIKHKAEYLDEAIKRAINHIKPCSDKKEEFRDTIIWLTLLDLAKQADEKILAFITNNTKDFYHNNQLHPDLQKDLNDHNIDIKIFPSLKDFIKNHSSKIDKYSIENIESMIKLEELNEEIAEEIIRNIDDLKKEIIRKKYEVYDYIELIQYDFNFTDVTVYEMQENNHYYIQAELCDEIEIEAEVENDDPYYEDEFGLQLKCFEFEMRAIVNFIFEGEKLIKQEIAFVEPC